MHYLKIFIFSDNFHTNLIEKFELEVCEFFVQSWAMKILADEIPARPKGHHDVCSVTQQVRFCYNHTKTINNTPNSKIKQDLP